MSISQLKGLGPSSQQLLAEVGIGSEQQFLATDPFEIYRLLKVGGHSASLNLLYAMIGAQQDQSWQSIKQTQKMEILMRLDDMGLAPK